MDAYLAKAKPFMVAKKADTVLNLEADKGCSPDISPQPVSLEPAFIPLPSLDRLLYGELPDHFVPEIPTNKDDLTRMRIWISPNQKLDWNRSELLLKQLSYASSRIGLEIVGNRDSVELRILLSRSDIPLALAAFKSQFEQCEIKETGGDAFPNIDMDTPGNIQFFDFYPSPPYSHLMTRMDELRRSPYVTIMSTLNQIPTSHFGLYQVIFKSVPADHDWHQNVRMLLDFEYMYKLKMGITNRSQYAQQAPSGDLHHMSSDVAVKAHDDKPFFFAALRIAVMGKEKTPENFLHPLSVMGSLIQHGGRPLNTLSESQYSQYLPEDKLRKMFKNGSTFRPGFLVNSWELASLVHIPPVELFESHQDKSTILETMPPDESLSSGTQVGFCSYTNTKLPVCISPDLRTKHVHLIGKSGMGKSTVMEHMILQDIQQGHGVAVLDPHGRLVQRLLCLLPKQYIKRTIFIDPGDPEWIPIWNPFRASSSRNFSHITDDLLRAMKSFVVGWGDRLEHILQHAILSVLHLPRASLLDVSDLLRFKSNKGKRLRNILQSLVNDEFLINFLNADYKGYSSADIHPAKHKLSKLLKPTSPTSLMLSQSDSLFEFRDIMDTGKILLFDFSMVGAEAREILGCFVLSLLHLTALSRGASPTASNRTFHIYCDEAHRLLTDSLEDLIAETRKFNVSLTLAHQSMDQFSFRKLGVLTGVGSTVIFNINEKDAGFFKRNLMGKVEQDDLMNLEIGQAIARINTQVVRMNTLVHLKDPAKHCGDDIIAYSRQQYCRKASEVRKAIRARDERFQEPLSPFKDVFTSRGTDHPGRRPEGINSRTEISHEGEFDYEEF